MRILIISLFTLLFLCPNSYSQSDCEDLIHYRDVELAQAWDNLHDQLAFNERELADYKKWKATLEDDYDGVTIGTLLSAVKGISNLITNTFELVTPTGKVIDISKTVSVETMNKINTVKAINGGIGDVQTLYEGGITEVIKSKLIGEMGLVGSLYTKINTLVDDLNEFNDFVDSRNEIKQMLAKFDELIEKHTKLVDESLSDFTEFNEYLNYITEYLIENCGG